MPARSESLHRDKVMQKICRNLARQLQEVSLIAVLGVCSFCEGSLDMRVHSLVFAALTVAAFCGEADAQSACSELTKLRGEAGSVVKDINGVATCNDLNRFALAWGGIVRYANEHRVSCQISEDSLIEIEGRYREALKMRDAVCTGRPLRPFPPEIIRW